MDAPEYGRYITIGSRRVVFSSLHLLMFAMGLVFIGEVTLGGLQTSGGGLLNLGGISREAAWAAGTSGWRSFFILDQWWRQFTSIFIHLSIAHLLMNAWAFYNLGRLADQIYGPTRLLLVFLVTGLAGGAASALWSHATDSPSWGGGASGAVCGILGLLLAHTRSRPDAMNQYIARQLLQWSVLILAFGLLVPNVNNAAHIGGFVAGYLLSKVLREGHFDGMRADRELTVVRMTAGLLTAATVVALLIGGLGARERYGNVSALDDLDENLEFAIKGQEQGRSSSLQVARRAIERIHVSDPAIRGLRDRAVAALEDNSEAGIGLRVQLKILKDDVTEVFASRAPDWFIRVSPR